MRTKIRKILTLHLLLFILIGCDDYYGTWKLEIANDLSHPITVRITGKDNSRDTLLLQPKRTANVLINSKTPSKANEGIRKISVFSETRRMLMILEGEQLNQYVIRKENNIDDILEGKESAPVFRFEVKEENIDFKLNNVMSSSANKNIDVDIIEIEEFNAND